MYLTLISGTLPTGKALVLVGAYKSVKGRKELFLWRGPKGSRTEGEWLGSAEAERQHARGVQSGGWGKAEQRQITQN